jgi:hypothetical protein
MTTATPPHRSVHPAPVRTPVRSIVGWTVRLLGAGCLAVSAYTHLHLASGYDFGPAITLGQLFLVQGVVCAVLGLWLLLRDSRPAWLISAAVMAASAAAVLMSSRTQLPAVGPLPGIYEPVWYAEKVVSAASEVAFLPLAVVRAALGWRQPGGASAP